MLRDAVYLAAKVSPKHFTNTVDFFLEADECVQPLPDGCQELRQIICIVDTKTGDDVSVSEGNEETLRRKLKYPSPCNDTACDDTALSSISYAAKTVSSSSFVVSPVPTEANRYKATAQCVSVDDWVGAGGTCEEIPESVRYMIPAVVQLTVGMALMTNRDHPNIVAQAQAHFAQFSNLLTLSRSQGQQLAQLAGAVA